MWCGSTRTTNKPDVVIITLEKPCSGLAFGFGSLWIPSCGAHTLVRADVARPAWCRRRLLRGRRTRKVRHYDGGGKRVDGDVSATQRAGHGLTLRPMSLWRALQLPKGSFNPIFAGDSVWVAIE